MELSTVAPGLTEVFHAEVGAAVVKALSASKSCADVINGHHGFILSKTLPKLISPAIGGRDWEEARAALARAMMADLHLQSWPETSRLSRDVRKEQPSLWTGLVILADWIASRQEEVIRDGDEAAVAARLLSEAGFTPLHLDRALSFHELFGFNPRPVQKSFVELYRGPGIYVLEAPTGCGKTEAALGLAYEAIRRGDSGGVYFALPTRLTSDKLYERVQSFVKQFAGDDVQLIHSGARAIQHKLGKEGEVGGTWFTTSRRALLARFGVGTIDQVLMAMLELKFSDLRRAALLGKVLILDEIHSYDAYTTVLIERLLKAIEAMGGTCIILSATLTHQARNKLLGLALEEILGGEEKNKPIQATVKQSNSVTSVSLESPQMRSITVRLLEDKALEVSLHEAIDKARAGMQVLWIENSLREAQSIYERIHAADGRVPAGLLHSQFRTLEREVLESKWTEHFGVEGRALRSEGGSILVGTQVLEQSLDIDADFLISRLAPMDLLVQRAGRLWRHADTPRPATCKEAEMFVLAEPESTTRSKLAADSENFGSSGLVYEPYLLYRTREVLKARLQAAPVLEFPECVRSLLEKVYDFQKPVAETESTEDIDRLRQKFCHTQKALADQARGVLSMTGIRADDDESEPCTRYIALAQKPVLILDEKDLDAAPEDAESLALWAEVRLVRPLAYLLAGEVFPKDGLYAERDAIKALRRLRRYADMAMLVLRENGSLVNIAGENLRNITYSMEYGVRSIH